MLNNKISVLLIISLLFYISFTSLNLEAQSEVDHRDVITIDVINKNEQQIEWKVLVNSEQMDSDEVTTELIASPGLHVANVFSVDTGENLYIEHLADGTTVFIQPSENEYEVVVYTDITEESTPDYYLKAKITSDNKNYETIKTIENDITENEDTNGNEEENSEVMDETDEVETTDESEQTNVETANEDEEETLNEDDDSIQQISSEEFTTFNSNIANENYRRGIQVNSTSSYGVQRLIIDPNVVAENMTVETASGLGAVEKHGLPSGDVGGNLNSYKTTIPKFFEGTGSQVLIYEDLRRWEPGQVLRYNGVEEEITITYDHVGYVDLQNGDTRRVDIGAKKVISNIILGAGPRWTEMGVAIDFSNNFYSGILYQYIQKMDIEIVYFEKDNPEKILNFIDSEESDAYMTFLSLNGYGITTSEWGNSALHYPRQSDGNEQQLFQVKTYEFAGSLEGVQGILSENSKLNYHTVGTVASANNSYYMNKNFGARANVHPEYEFDDFLGGATFLDSGVTFPLSGTTHKFKLGSTYGYTWNSFSSVSVQPVNHNHPVKTVQPLLSSENKQYTELCSFVVQENNEQYREYCKDSDFSNRYYNDYDRLWKIPEAYWIDEHSPHTLNEEQITNRYVKTGEEFYYFINQDAISIHTHSLVMPNVIEIEDILPEGVTLATGTLEDLTLYNLDGAIIPLSIDEWSYDNETRKLNVILFPETTKKINDLVIAKANGSRTDIGDDFSLRIKAKVEKEAGDTLAENIMINEAKTILKYGTDENAQVEFERTSNRVETAIRKLDVEKVWEDVNNFYELRPESITIKLTRQIDDNELIDIKEITLDDANDWQHTFTSYDIGSGKHTIEEVTVNEHYTVSYDGCALDGSELGDVCTVTNTLLTTNVEMTKTTSSGAPLFGATFTLYDESDREIATATSDSEGMIKFENLIQGTYYVKETAAPNGFTPSDKKYEFVVQADENQTLTVSYTGDNWTNENDIVNEVKPFNIEIVKEDNFGERISDVQFSIYKENEVDPLQQKNTDENGIAQFENLLPGKYTIKETEGKLGYELSEFEIVFTIDADGKVTFEDETIEYSSTLTTEGNNEIKVTTPFINNKKEYELIVKKIDESDHTVLLEGAQFELYDEKGEKVGEHITNEFGEITFTGLFIGKYELKEIKAPEGYRLLKKPIEVEITGEQLEVTIEVENSKTGWELPGVGGMGTILFYVLGALIMLGTVLYYLKRKKQYKSSTN